MKITRGFAWKKLLKQLNDKATTIIRWLNEPDLYMLQISGSEKELGRKAGNSCWSGRSVVNFSLLSIFLVHITFFFNYKLKTDLEKPDFPAYQVVYLLNLSRSQPRPKLLWVFKIAVSDAPGQ